MKWGARVVSHESGPRQMSWLVFSYFSCFDPANDRNHHDHNLNPTPNESSHTDPTYHLDDNNENQRPTTTMTTNSNHHHHLDPTPANRATQRQRGEPNDTGVSTTRKAETMRRREE